MSEKMPENPYEVGLGACHWLGMTSLEEAFNAGAKAQRDLAYEQDWRKVPSVEEMTAHIKQWLFDEANKGVFHNGTEGMAELHRWLLESEV